MKKAKERDEKEKKPPKVELYTSLAILVYANTLQASEKRRPIVESHPLPHHEEPYRLSTYYRAT